jgi:hypothetical protein
MFPCSCPTFTFSVQPEDFADQTVGWNDQPGSQSPKLGLYGQRQTSWHSKAPKFPKVIIKILFAEAEVLGDNDPSAGSPIETLLQIFTSSNRYSSVVFPPVRQRELPGKQVKDLTKTLNW